MHSLIDRQAQASHKPPANDKVRLGPHCWLCAVVCHACKGQASFLQCQVMLLDLDLDNLQFVCSGSKPHRHNAMALSLDMIQFLQLPVKYDAFTSCTSGLASHSVTKRQNFDKGEGRLLPEKQDAMHLVLSRAELRRLRQKTCPLLPPAWKANAELSNVANELFEIRLAVCCIHLEVCDAL